jgi:ABC-2 type transport system permease protein
VSRTALVLAPMIVGAIQVVIQSVVVFAIGWGLGADPATGVGGVVVVLLLALFWGLGFAGFSVAVGLHTGNAQAAQSATLIFFPLIFLSPIFLPEDQLKDWMQTVSTVNPTTYALQGMRSLLIEGWNAEDIGAAVAAIGGFVALTLGFAVLVARRATRRG